MNMLIDQTTCKYKKAGNCRLIDNSLFLCIKMNISILKTQYTFNNIS